MLAMEKSGRVLTTRALAAMLFNLATASSLLKRAWTARVRGVWGARRRVREVAGRVRARREGAMAAGGKMVGDVGRREGYGDEFIEAGRETLRWPDSGADGVGARRERSVLSQDSYISCLLPAIGSPARRSSPRLSRSLLRSDFLAPHRSSPTRSSAPSRPRPSPPSPSAPAPTHACRSLFNRHAEALSSHPFCRPTFRSIAVI